MFILDSEDEPVARNVRASGPKHRLTNDGLYYYFTVLLAACPKVQLLNMEMEQLRVATSACDNSERLTQRRDNS